MFKRIYIEITNICNLNCSFCKEDNRKKEYMDIEKFKAIAYKIKGYTNNVYLHIKGEPLMHPHIEEILKVLEDNNLNANITTNGRLIKDKINILKNSKIRQINVSLHSYDDISQVAEMLNYIDDIKGTYVSFRLWNNEDNKGVIEVLNKHYNTDIDLNDSKRITITDNRFLSLDSMFEWPNINYDVISENGTCLGLISQIGILVDGTVVPCCLDQDGDIGLGNIFEESLEEILKKEKCKEIIRGFKNKELTEALCKRCGYRTRFDK